MRVGRDGDFHISRKAKSVFDSSFQKILTIMMISIVIMAVKVVKETEKIIILVIKIILIAI